MERNTVPFRFCKSRVPLVTFRLAGEEHYAIIDTGSEITIIDESLRDKIKTKEIDVETNFIGVNGSSGYRNLVQGACRISLQATDGEDTEVVLAGMVSNLDAVSNHFRDKNGEFIPIAALIGGDFLKHYQVKIDYKRKTLTINHEIEFLKNEK